MQTQSQQSVSQKSTKKGQCATAQRIRELAKFYNLSVRAFERSCKLTEGYIASMRESISLTMLDKIVEHYPEVNPVWVLLGEGKMFKDVQEENSGETVTMDREVWEEIQKMAETVNSQQRTIAVQAESIRHQTDSLFLLLRDAKIEGLTIAKLSPNESKIEK